jgi:hypothetical protein
MKPNARIFALVVVAAGLILRWIAKNKAKSALLP